MKSRFAWFLMILAVGATMTGRAYGVNTSLDVMAQGCTNAPNQFSSLQDVYIRGTNLPAGDYYIEVTAPPDQNSNNETLLGSSTTAVLHSDGTTTDCINLWNNVSKPGGGNGFDVTTNNGGEYKVYVSTDPTFPNNNSEKGNFHIPHACPATGCPPATVTVCKFWDQNTDGIHNNGEPLIPGWPIAATGVDANPPTQTDSTGCATFTVSNFGSDGTQTVTLTEGSITGWTQTAPSGASYPGGVITLTVSPNDALRAPDFGNYCSSCDLQVTKTAIPTFTRTYNWTISKTVDKDQTAPIEQSGGAMTANYTVTATETGFIDSAWAVSGKITVKNPNSLFAVTATVTDAVDNGGTCIVQGGTNVSVPASQSVVLDYTCSYSGQPTTSSGTNTATATWDSFTKTGLTATGNATFNFDTPTTTVNKTVTVTDTYNSGSPTNLGTVTATDVTPYATATYKYPHSDTIVGGSCKTYSNTAAITETGQTASTSFTVCNMKTGALTIGYWQNKNGQGIISNYCGGTGVTTLYAFLTGYNPFKDLPTPTKCSDIGTYVNNVIKAASAGGASMNAMLKAQDLATSLDVYFSDPALGGNKIVAAQPLASVQIDLTNVCIVVDAGGYGTCSGKFESVSAAFGANKMTVGVMLSTAASQSNSGGSSWYGQNKTTQGLAKNAFDAINNQIAYIATP